MDAERWTAVEALAWRLMALEGAERQRALDLARTTDSDLAAEADALLTEWSTDPDFMEAPIASVVDPEVRGAAPDAAERWIGPFRIVRPLGRGGMGQVYLAVEQAEGLRRHVALKVLRPDLE
ncbi:MAG: hypothetical protein KJP18_08215, partial [Gemmatimonadetes bacterium]|nr:hypothetical protein [Gemmatimonadota bacterium]